MQSFAEKVKKGTLAESSFFTFSTQNTLTVQFMIDTELAIKALENLDQMRMTKRPTNADVRNRRQRL